MTSSARCWAAVACLTVVGAGVFLSGIDWGLPSRAVDPYLFGQHQPWSGKQILELAGGWAADPSRGADVDVNPLARSDQPIVLNATDAQKAEIIRRYRLFTYQPDEWLTFKALAEMKPSRLQLDPKVYQYGGLWFYPVGAMLKAASMAGLIHVTADLTYYLDHPEAFGRFYVVARLYSALWGLVGVFAVFWIARRLVGDGGVLVPAFAAACYIVMPVVVNMAHEAKPHLPGAVLMLLAVVAATKYVETGRRRWWLAAGGLCGAAFGMVLSSLVIFSILPVMVMLRAEPWRRRVVVLIGACAVGAVVYCVTNPYVPINYLANRQVLYSNLRNSTAMYGVSGTGEGFWTALSLIAVGMSPPLALCGAVMALVATVAPAYRRLVPRGDRDKGRLGGQASGEPLLRSPGDERLGGSLALPVPAQGTRHRPEASDSVAPSSPSCVAWLLAVPAMIVLGQFIALAGGKPGEYARFGLFLDIALAIAATAGFGRLLADAPRRRVFILALLLVTTSTYGFVYLRGFVLDSGTMTSRLEAARTIEGVRDMVSQPPPLLVTAEPAPYSLPPVNLFDAPILLLPRSAAPGDLSVPAGLLVRVTDVAAPRATGMDTLVVRTRDLTFAGRQPERRPGVMSTPLSWADKPFAILFPTAPAPQTTPTTGSTQP